MAWKPTFTLSLIEYMNDASSCPVASPMIGENGVMTSRTVSRYFERQLYAMRASTGPLAYINCTLTLSLDRLTSGRYSVFTFESTVATPPVDCVLRFDCGTPWLSMYV